jgi:site-specific DNA recombinase
MRKDRRTDPANRTAIGWVRVSTKKQSGPDRLSPEFQRAAIERVAAREKLGPLEMRMVTETGWRGERRQFEALQQEIVARGIGHLIVLNTDRLTRHMRGKVEVADLIEKTGLTLHFAEKDGKSISASNLAEAEDEWEDEVKFARKYVQKLSRYSRETMEMLIEKGAFPFIRSVYGYDLAKHQLIPNENAPLVRRAFELYATGHESETSLWEKMKAEGMRLSVSALNQLLHSPVVMGYMAYPFDESKYVGNRKRGELVRGTWEPIVERDLWGRVQHLLRSKTHSHPLREKQLWMRYRGLITCQCKPLRGAGPRTGGLVYSGSKKGKKVGVWYTPNHRPADRSVCSERSVSEAEVDAAVERELKRFTFPAELVKRAKVALEAARDEGSKEAKAEMVRWKRESRTVADEEFKLLGLALKDRFSAEVLDRKSAELQERRRNAEAAKARLSVDRDRFVDDALAMLAMMKDLEGVYRAASEKRKAELLRVLFREIEVKDGRFIFHPEEAFEVFYSLGENPAARLPEPFFLGVCGTRSASLGPPRVSSGFHSPGR